MYSPLNILTKCIVHVETMTQKYILFMHTDHKLDCECCDKPFQWATVKNDQLWDPKSGSAYRGAGPTFAQLESSMNDEGAGTFEDPKQLSKENRCCAICAEHIPWLCPVFLVSQCKKMYVCAACVQKESPMFRKPSQFRRARFTCTKCKNECVELISETYTERQCDLCNDLIFQRGWSCPKCQLDSHTHCVLKAQPLKPT